MTTIDMSCIQPTVLAQAKVSKKFSLDFSFPVYKQIIPANKADKQRATTKYFKFIPTETGGIIAMNVCFICFDP